MTRWLPLYDAEKGISDLVAGITVGLTLIPQSIAYAALAGLGPEVGAKFFLSNLFVGAISDAIVCFCYSNFSNFHRKICVNMLTSNLELFYRCRIIAVGFRRFGVSSLN